MASAADLADLLHTFANSPLVSLLTSGLFVAGVWKAFSIWRQHSDNSSTLKKLGVDVGQIKDVLGPMHTQHVIMWDRHTLSDKRLRAQRDERRDRTTSEIAHEVAIELGLEPEPDPFPEAHARRSSPTPSRSVTGRWHNDALPPMPEPPPRRQGITTGAFPAVTVPREDTEPPASDDEDGDGGV